MSEIANVQTNEQDMRPLGRFLLSNPDEHETKSSYNSEIYHYANDFAMKYDDLLVKNRSSFITISEMDEAGEVVIPINTPVFNEAIWVEFDQTFAESNKYVWRISCGRNEYELATSEESNELIEYEINVQGAVNRRKIINDPETIDGLDSLIKDIVDHPTIEAKINAHYDVTQKDMLQLEALRVIGSRRALTVRETKEMASLKSRISSPFFHSGSLSHRDKLPLINPFG